MTGFPTLMYYLWICLVFYDGQLVFPNSTDDIVPFFGRMWEHIRVVRVVRDSIIPEILKSHCRTLALTGMLGKSMVD
jgi:hypothetical protein